jgi:Uma2 family endonuclease
VTLLETAAPSLVTVGDLLELIDRLGGIPVERVRLSPLPGTATEQDVIDIRERERRLCELVDGVLVEKPMGLIESLLAAKLIHALISFVESRNLGIVAGEGGMIRLFAGLVRIPDVLFASWDTLPNRRTPTEAVPGLAPDLVVEVLSQSNTKAEMDRKRSEYFRSGVRLCWIVDPARRTVAVFTDPNSPVVVLSEDDVLDGGAVLAGFTLSLRAFFSVLDRQG